LILPTLPTGSRRQGGSTRDFGQHLLSEGVLLSFTDWLQTVDGKERSRDQAIQISVDVSKYLHFCDQEVAQTHFAYEPLEFNRYLTALQKASLTPAGMLVKILRLRNFLDFILSGTPSADEEAKVQKMITKLKNWHSHFAKQKYKVRQFVDDFNKT